jgi:hypothetical protein
MDLGFADKGRAVEARLVCTGPRTLRTGRRGYYEVAFLPWMFDSKFRCQISVTETSPGYGYALIDAGEGVRQQPHHGNPCLTLARTNDVVTVRWVLPDCLRPLPTSRFLGASGTWTLALPSGRHNCSALLTAQPTSTLAVLRWRDDALEFCETKLGKTLVMHRMKRSGGEG